MREVAKKKYTQMITAENPLSVGEFIMRKLDAKTEWFNYTVMITQTDESNHNPLSGTKE